MKKVFGIAALLLALAACNKVETEITPVEQPSDSKGITITATLAPKTADTKAVADGGDKITVTWAENEHIAILYDKDGAQVADAWPMPPSPPWTEPLALPPSSSP